MTADLRRVVLLGIALGAVVFGAVLGRLGECNLVAVTGGSVSSTLAGCGQAPAGWAPLSLLVAAVSVALACRRRPGDSTAPEVRRRSVVALVAIAVVGTAVLFALLRPGYAEISDAGSFLCHRPIQDLHGPADDSYATGCRDLAERRVAFSGVSVSALVLLAVVARVRRVRSRVLV